MSIIVTYFCTSHLPFNSTLHCHKLIWKKLTSFICNDSHVSIEHNMTETKENEHNTHKKGSREKAKRYFYRSQKIEIERAFI